MCIRDSISTIGVQMGERLQMVLMTIQMLAMVLFGVLALVNATNGSYAGSVPFDWDWFNPAELTSWSGFIAVPYTHLDVYKRQVSSLASPRTFPSVLS